MSKGPICTCGHAFSSHRQDHVDPWATERCKTCGCSAFFDGRESEGRDPEDDDAGLRGIPSAVATALRADPAVVAATEGRIYAATPPGPHISQEDLRAAITKVVKTEALGRSGLTPDHVAGVIVNDWGVRDVLGLRATEAGTETS